MSPINKIEAKNKKLFHDSPRNLIKIKKPVTGAFFLFFKHSVRTPLLATEGSVMIQFICTEMTGCKLCMLSGWMRSVILCYTKRTDKSNILCCFDISNCPLSLPCSLFSNFLFEPWKVTVQRCKLYTNKSVSHHCVFKVPSELLV